MGASVHDLAMRYLLGLRWAPVAAGVSWVEMAADFCCQFGWQALDRRPKGALGAPEVRQLVALFRRTVVSLVPVTFPSDQASWFSET
eukprot:13460806-Alexandrium_andersonii.AAC.1